MSADLKLMTDADLRDELAVHLKGGSRQRWNWIKHDGVRISRPAIDAGTISSGGDHSERFILEALVSANRRQAERRRSAWKRAAATRAMRVEKLVYQEARALLNERVFRPGNKCRICGKAITDDLSKSRGIGSDCWQRVLAAVAEYGKDGALVEVEDSFEVIRRENEAGAAQCVNRLKSAISPNLADDQASGGAT